MLRADMIIFHAPDVLEFALDGRSLGEFHEVSARTIFQKIANLPEHTGPQVISNLYAEIFAIAAPTIQRLERTEPL